MGLPGHKKRSRQNKDDMITMTMTWNKSSFRMQPSLYRATGSWGWAVILTVILVGGYFLLQPKIAATLLPSQAQRSVQALITQFESTGSIDPQYFWQWREMYSPGYLTVNELAVAFGETQYITQVASPSTKLVSYHSPLVSSTDSVVLTSLTEINGGYFDRTAVVGKPVIFLEDKRQVFFDDQTVIVQFVQPISVMKETVGLFNFTQAEQELLQHYSWVHRSEITLPPEFELPPVQ